MSSRLQKEIYAGVAGSIVLLAAIGLANENGYQTGRDSVHPHTQTVTVDRIVTLPAQTITKTVTGSLSPACTLYLTDANALVGQFMIFTKAYGGVADELSSAFVAIETHNEQALADARMAISKMDQASSDAVSQILQNYTKVANEKKGCES